MTNKEEFRENAEKYFHNKKITEELEHQKIKELKMKLYAIKDKMGEFNFPFTQLNKAVATRTFADACNNQQSNIYKIAGDMELYELGDFSTETGKIEPKIPEKIADGAEYVAVRNAEKNS